MHDPYHYHRVGWDPTIVFPWAERGYLYWCSEYQTTKILTPKNHEKLSEALANCVAFAALKA